MSCKPRSNEKNRRSRITEYFQCMVRDTSQNLTRRVDEDLIIDDKNRSRKRVEKTSAWLKKKTIQYAMFADSKTKPQNTSLTDVQHRRRRGFGRDSQISHLIQIMVAYSVIYLKDIAKRFCDLKIYQTNSSEIVFCLCQEINVPNSREQAAQVCQERKCTNTSVLCA